MAPTPAVDIIKAIVFLFFGYVERKKNETKSCRNIFVADVGFVDKLLKQ